MQTLVRTLACILPELGSYCLGGGGTMVGEYLTFCKKFRVQKDLTIWPFLNISEGQENKITPTLYRKYVKKFMNTL